MVSSTDSEVSYSLASVANLTLCSSVLPYSVPALCDGVQGESGHIFEGLENGM